MTTLESEYDVLARLVKANAEHAQSERARADDLQRQLNAVKESSGITDTWREEEYQKLVAAADVRAEELIKEKHQDLLRAVESLEEELEESQLEVARQIERSQAQTARHLKARRNNNIACIIVLVLYATIRHFVG